MTPTETPYEAILRDGASIVIRPVAHDDRPRLISLFERMSPASIHHRFFGAKRALGDAELRELTDDLGPGYVALAATTQHGDDEIILGVGRYVVVDEARGIAEVAFDVADADQGRGIGTLLLEHLARVARRGGIATFRADVEASNGLMVEVLYRCGFAMRERLDRDIHHFEFSTADTECVVAMAATRERLAAARSLRAIFAPASVAVVGASRTPGTIGRAILDNLVRDGFRGAIYPVNPHTTTLAGRRCYPSIAAIAAPVELAVIAVGAPQVEATVRECAVANVRAVLVISAGFAEVGAKGRDTERRLRAIARRAGMRMVGPNCMGVLSTDPAVCLNATFSPVYPPAGNVSMATQSGALGLAMLDHARDLELGIAEFASIGNKADVSVNDLLSYWYDDPRTDVIALYLESFGNPRTSRGSRPRSRAGVRSSRSSQADRRPGRARHRATPRRWRASTSASTPCSHRPA